MYPLIISRDMSIDSLENMTTACDTSTSEGSSLSNYLYVLLLGRFVCSWSGSVLFALGVKYIDDSVPEKDSAFYVGVYIFGADTNKYLYYTILYYEMKIYEGFNLVTWPRMSNSWI